METQPGCGISECAAVEVLPLVSEMELLSVQQSAAGPRPWSVSHTQDGNTLWNSYFPQS